MVEKPEKVLVKLERAAETAAKTMSDIADTLDKIAHDLPSVFPGTGPRRTHLLETADRLRAAADTLVQEARSYTPETVGWILRVGKALISGPVALAIITGGTTGAATAEIEHLTTQQTRAQECLVHVDLAVADARLPMTLSWIENLYEATMSILDELDLGYDSGMTPKEAGLDLGETRDAQLSSIEMIADLLQPALEAVKGGSTLGWSRPLRRFDGSYKSCGTNSEADPDQRVIVSDAERIALLSTFRSWESFHWWHETLSFDGSRRAVSRTS